MQRWKPGRLGAWLQNLKVELSRLYTASSNLGAFIHWHVSLTDLPIVPHYNIKSSCRSMSSIWIQSAFTLLGTICWAFFGLISAPSPPRKKIVFFIEKSLILDHLAFENLLLASKAKTWHISESPVPTTAFHVWLFKKMIREGEWSDEDIGDSDSNHEGSWENITFSSLNVVGNWAAAALNNSTSNHIRSEVSNTLIRFSSQHALTMPLYTFFVVDKRIYWEYIQIMFQHVHFKCNRN